MHHITKPLLISAIYHLRPTISNPTVNPLPTINPDKPPTD